MNRKKENKSYKQIAKSTGIFGGSQIITIISGFIRNKALSILIGPAGIGLAGILQSAVEMVKTIAGFGLSSSSVKDLAESVQSEDKNAFNKTVTIQKRLFLWSAVTGALIIAAFSGIISKYLFKDYSYRGAFLILSVSVFSGIISSGQTAIIQGKRHLKDLALLSICGSVINVVISVLFYYFLGINGIVPVLVAYPVVFLLLSWTFSRKIDYERVKLSIRETLHGGKSMARLGFYNMLAGLVSTLSMFLIKGFVMNKSDLILLGLYQAVWAVSAQIIGSILSAMGTDYYPRLCNVNKSSRDMSILTNEQTRFVLLIVAPVLALCFIFVIPILKLLYSSDFSVAENLFRWQLLGSFFKVFVWPLTFIILAKGKGLKFFITELVWFVLYYAFVRILWNNFGLESLGMAYLISHVLSIPLIYYYVFSLTKFKYNNKNVKLFTILFVLILSVFISTLLLKGLLFWVISLILAIVTIVFSLIELNKILPFKMVFEKIINKFRK